MANSIAGKKSSYKILGVDPGTNILGYAVLEVQGSLLRVLSFGVFRLEKYEDHHEKLKEIYLQLQEIIETYLPEQLAIEAPFYGKNVQSMLKLGRAQGVAMAAAITMGLEIQEYAPKKIKQSITGNGNASKEQVAAMLESILKIKISSKHLDATDALGVAVCHYNQSSNILAGLKKHSGWASFIKNNPDKILTGKVATPHKNKPK
ncbi:MAG: crossover junction endodeoxyribonuclease RuvC [Chitinophagales bacterium]|nr:crossover junction endodeoxyribonuclease RuvC [Chitinophagales bacterium]